MRQRHTVRKQGVSTLALVTVLVFPFVPSAQPCEDADGDGLCDIDCTDNSPPVAVCPDWIEVPLDDECAWQAVDIVGDSFDPDGHPFTCEVSPDQGQRRAVVGGDLICTDACGAVSESDCVTDLVPRDQTPVEIETSDLLTYLTYGGPTFVIQDDWLTNWSQVREVCGLSFEDNCDREYALRRGITAVEPSRPGEEMFGEPGAFLSDGMATDWAGFLLNLDRRQGAVARSYDITYTVLDRADNVATTVCSVDIVEGDCRSDDDCLGDSYCWRPIGQCGGLGLCQALGDCQGPLMEARWVCGCDGRSHYNACSAQRVRLVNVAHDGPCNTEPTCTSASDCANDEYCYRPENECLAEGVCRLRPDLGQMGPDLVCGCDGTVYDGEASAAEFGTSVLGPISRDMLNHGVTCGVLLAEGECFDTDDCTPGFPPKYCATPENQCGGVGVCQDRLVDCPWWIYGNEYEPHCGCDGRTYFDWCSATGGHGMAIDFEGVCPDEPPCTHNGDCDANANEYCYRPSGHCTAPQGVCRPEATPAGPGERLVCGCDGDIYTGEIMASSGGMSVLGPAVMNPAMPWVAEDCAVLLDDGQCFDQDDCGPGLWCEYVPGLCGNVGECRDGAQDCDLDHALPNPVCGCDGRTHYNACSVYNENVSVAHDGPCPNPVVCTANVDCDGDEYCHRAMGVCASAAGECRPVALSPGTSDWVCGCDGVSREGAMLAAAEGVNLLAPIRCEDL